MNHSIYSADRMTHLKIVVVALFAAVSVAAFGVSARFNADEGNVQTARVIKADSLQMTAGTVSQSLVR